MCNNLPGNKFWIPYLAVLTEPQIWEVMSHSVIDQLFSSTKVVEQKSLRPETFNDLMPLFILFPITDQSHSTWHSACCCQPAQSLDLRGKSVLVYICNVAKFHSLKFLELFCCSDYFSILFIQREKFTNWRKVRNQRVGWGRWFEDINFNFFQRKNSGCLS